MIIDTSCQVDNQKIKQNFRLKCVVCEQRVVARVEVNRLQMSKLMRLRLGLERVQWGIARQFSE